MKLTLQRRLMLSFLPILALIGVLGIAGRILLDRLGNAGQAILRENYDSVVAMVDLNEALERIDSSFQFGIHGQEDAHDIYEKHWALYGKHLDRERRNITLPGEKELVRKIDDLTALYREEGDRFWKLKNAGERKHAYFASEQPPALLTRFRQIKDVSEAIREINQRNMEESSRDAKRLAESSRWWFTGGLAGAAVLAVWLSWWIARSVVRPVEELKKAAAAIGRGELEQHIPIKPRDEIGELAETFNLMAQQLRDLRQSHRARLLRTQQASQATIDSFPDPVLVIDPEGNVHMANPAARRLLGVSPPEGAMAVVTQWIPPEPLQQPLSSALRNQQPYLSQAFDQAVTFRIGNEDRIFLPHILPIRDPYGGTLGAAVVLNDVTRFRLMDQFKSDLVATVDHELKTPLTSVRLAIHVLLEETVGALTAKQTELLIDARENAERLLNLIEHLLALARLENAKEILSLEPIGPRALLQRTADASTLRAQDKHVEIDVQADESLPPVAVDLRRIAVALNNLLENAVTYTPSGGSIVLSAEQVDDEQIALAVKDTGIGIPQEYLPRIFDKFFRVPGQSEGAGTGLGLAIVKEIVAAHGGRITCESEPGKGTTFRLTLQVWRNEPRTA